MGSYGFGQGFFGQYSVGGTAPVIVQFGTMTELSAADDNVQYTAVSLIDVNAVDYTALDTADIYTARFDG